MCNVMVSYFKINQKFQRNERQSRSERADPRILKQAYQSMIRAIVFGQIRDGASRSEQIELKGMIRFEQSRVKSSGEKCGRQERSKNTTEGEKSCSKREEKIAVRRSERRLRKIVRSRSEQAVYCRTTQREEKIRSEKVDKKRRQSTQDDEG